MNQVSLREHVIHTSNDNTSRWESMSLFGKSYDKWIEVESMFLLFCGLCFKIVYEGNMYKNQASLWKHRWVWMFETSVCITITFESHGA